ncbi:MAG: type IV secretory system conjugative DNA transfer family protein, partial [Patescibacteria group bacterium]
DPSDTKYPVSFNPLQNVDPEMKHQLTQGLIEVLEKQFGANWTPRLEHVFRFTVLALLDYPYATMRGMISMLTDREYRQKVVDYITDDMVKRFWAVEFADWSEKFDTEAIIPLVNKLGQFLSDPLLRNIFAQRENKIDLKDIMNNKKILLINLSKGKLGEENSSFFGSMFITKIKQAGMSRADMPEQDRVDFYLYVDEFHNLVTETFENLFSEARKYGLCLIVAHQYMQQLLPPVQATVLGNSGTLVIFRVGGEDAKRLEAEMTPIFKAKDMINLGMREFYIKMTIDGNTYDPFSAETLKVFPATHPSNREKIIQWSREHYAMPAGNVKKMIEEEEKELLFGKRGSSAGSADSPLRQLADGGGQGKSPTPASSGPPPLI